MNDDEEKAYLQGKEVAALGMLNELKGYLPYEYHDAAVANAYIVETRLALYRLFDDLDIKDKWFSDLHLADLIRRLGRALERRGK